MSDQRATATLPPDPSQYVPGRMVSGLPAPTRPVTLDGQAVIPEQPAAPQPPVTAQPQTAAGRAQALNSPMLLSDVIASPGGADALADALIHREGGSPAGVVNNPGNIKFAGLPGQRDSGVQATDGGTFASYDSPQEGRQAIIRLAANAAAGQSFAYGQKPTVATFASIYGGHQGGSEGTTPNYQAITARGQQIADRESAEIRRLIAEADKADPDSQLRHQRLQRAMDHSERLSQQFEEMARPPPTETPLDMMQNFGSLATVIALAGGLLAKRPLTAALNAAGSAMRAQQEGNHEQAQRAYKVWQDQTELISKALNFQNQEINQIMEDRRLSEAERRDKIGEHLRLYGMQQALDQWNLGNQVEVFKLLQSLPKAQAELDRIKAETGKAKAQKDYYERGGARGGTPLEVSKMFDVVDDKGKVVKSGIMLRERKDQPGFIDSATGEPLVLGPNEHLKQITATTSGGGRAGQMGLRQEIGAREVQSDLENAINLPLGTTIGPLGTVHTGPTIGEAVQGDLVRKMTDQDSQLMQASMANMTRELSILMSPVYGGNWAAQQIDPLIPKSGETLATVIFKLARLAQTADNALEIVAISPTLSNEQQQKAVEMREAIQAAIPWTSKQALEFTYQGQPHRESFGEFMKRNTPSPDAGKLPEGVPEGSKKLDQTKDGHPVYEAPDGSRYVVH